MSLPNEDLIPIERLACGNIIYRKGGDFGPFGSFAEVQNVEFDIDGFYTITARLMETDGAEEWIGDEALTFTVDAGDCVEFGGRGEPRLRDMYDITIEELEATAAAHELAADRAIVQGMERSGYVGRDIDDQLMTAVAKSLNLPADVQAVEVRSAAE